MTLLSWKHNLKITIYFILNITSSFRFNVWKIEKMQSSIQRHAHHNGSEQSLYSLLTCHCWLYHSFFGFTSLPILSSSGYARCSSSRSPLLCLTSTGLQTLCSLLTSVNLNRCSGTFRSTSSVALIVSGLLVSIGLVYYSILLDNFLLIVRLCHNSP